MRATSERILRVTADDLAYSPGVTDAIMRCAREGIVTHASLLVSGIDCARAVALARGVSALRVGVHLALTELPPVLAPDQIPSLVDTEGRFWPIGHLALRTP